MRSDDNGNRIVNARELTVTGLSRGTDLLSHKNSDDTVSITTGDIKPLQNHDNVRLEDGTIVESADILATRIITWGLPGIGPVGSETGNMPSELNGNLVGIDAMLRNGIYYAWGETETKLLPSTGSNGLLNMQSFSRRAA